MLIALSIWLCYWLLSFPISSATICCFSVKTCNILRTENMICFMKIWYALYVICILGIQWGHLPAYFNSELDCTFEVNLVTRGHHSLVHMIWECHALDEIRRNYIRCDVLHQGAYQGTQGAFSPLTCARTSLKQRPSETIAGQSLGSQHQLFTLQLCSYLSVPLANLDIEGTVPWLILLTVTEIKNYWCNYGCTVGHLTTSSHRINWYKNLGCNSGTLAVHWVYWIWTNY